MNDIESSENETTQTQNNQDTTTIAKNEREKSKIIVNSKITHIQQEDAKDEGDISACASPWENHPVDDEKTMRSQNSTQNIKDDQTSSHERPKTIEQSLQRLKIDIQDDDRNDPSPEQPQTPLLTHHNQELSGTAEANEELKAATDLVNPNSKPSKPIIDSKTTTGSQKIWSPSLSTGTTQLSSPSSNTLSERPPLSPNMKPLLNNQQLLSADSVNRPPQHPHHPLAQPNEYITESSLLRLFQSEFFTTWLAVNYIAKYPHEIGIQYYLCDQLTKMPTADIEYMLPQLCHFLIFKKSKSVALEHFLIEQCQISTHLAILMLWYLEAYLYDLGDSSSEELHKCRRMHRRCQEILFGDTAPSQPSSNQASRRHSIFSFLKRKRIRENITPALIGIGLCGACLVPPYMLDLPRRSVILQGQAKKWVADAPLITHAAQQRSAGHMRSQSAGIPERQSSPLDPPAEKKHSNRSWNKLKLASRIPSSSPSFEELQHGKVFSFNRFLAQQPSSLAHIEPSQLSHSHYFYSEMQFARALNDITNRLTALPKASRQKSLIAELTLLNYNLPAEVCVPLWCPGGSDVHHHSVVRISPEEATVLNSAERVPYLIFVEVLEDSIHELIKEEEARSMHNLSSPNTPIRKLSLYAINETTAVLNDNPPNTAASSPITRPRRKSRVLQSNLNYQNPIEDLPTTEADITSLQGQSNTSTPIEPKIQPNADSELMRTAAIMLGQLSKAPPNSQAIIREKIVSQMMEMEQRRMKSIENGEELSGAEPTRTSINRSRESKDDPSASVFRESFDAKVARIRDASPYGQYPSWRLLSVIVKTASDLRQEQLACQLIREMQQCLISENVDVWLYSYRVLITGPTSGLVETVPDTISVHSLRKLTIAKRGPQQCSLLDWLVHELGDGDISSPIVEILRDNFMKSLAAYSVITYILQVKDRHNGNILIDNQGHVVHIDFGFMLSNSPGAIAFETAAFKFPLEYLDVLGGIKSPRFAKLKSLMVSSFMAIRKHAEKIMLLVEMMSQASKFPCFGTNPELCISSLRERFALNQTEKQVQSSIELMVYSSCGNNFTKLYDLFQYYSQGVM